jgi:predicted ATP-dependent endonuclease of OLD family
LVDAINSEVKNWKIKFGVEINPLRPEDIVKSLLTHYIEDENLGGERVSISSYGQGLQRHVIYTLIRLSAQFTALRTPTRKEFAPDFTMILFEEPESFLHPSQQDRLNSSLRALAQGDTQQVFVTTHSPKFVSRQINDLPSLIRFYKPECETRSFQISSADLDELLDENVGLYRKFCDILADPATPKAVVSSIRTHHLADTTPDEASRLVEESIRYFLYLDAERSAAFFAKRVVICEGASEVALFNYLCENRWSHLRDRHVYFLDSLGKFNVHRYI